MNIFGKLMMVNGLGLAVLMLIEKPMRSYYMHSISTIQTAHEEYLSNNVHILH